MRASMDDRPWSCGEALAAIPRWMDGELEAALVVALRRHLEACRACAAEAVAQQQLAATLRAEFPIERGLQLPTGGELADRARRRALAGGTLSWPRIGWGLAWAGTAAVVAVVGGGQARHHGDGRPVATSAVASNSQLPALVVLDDERYGRRVLLGGVDTRSIVEREK